MSTEWKLDSPAQKFGFFLFGLSIWFCGEEMVPAWSRFNLDWPSEVFYGIMAVSSAISGMLIARNYLIPGLVGGLLAGPGGLFAAALLLENVNSIHGLIIVVVGLVGCLPGVGVGFGLKALQDRFAQPPDEGPSPRLDDDGRRPWPADAPPRLPDDRTMPRDDGMHLRD